MIIYHGQKGTQKYFANTYVSIENNVFFFSCGVLSDPVGTRLTRREEADTSLFHQPKEAKPPDVRKEVGQHTFHGGTNEKDNNNGF